VCQKLLKSASVSWSYSKIIVARFVTFMDQGTLKVILFLNSSHDSGKTKEYLIAVLKQ